MEHLTKQQIILLALLVSFVSSIATGIVTVSLLDQAPPAVSQTINRVVERTIERVAPQATSTKEIIVVKDDEAVVDSIAKASKSIVEIRDVSGFLGLGVIVSSSGTIVSNVGTNASGLSARLSGGNVVSLSFVSQDSSSGLSVFKAEQGTGAAFRAYSSAILADSDSLKLGQSVVALTLKESPVVATGIVSHLAHSEEGDKSVTRIVANIRDPAFDSQAVLVNLLGEVVGLRTKTEDQGFTPSNIIKIYATP